MKEYHREWNYTYMCVCVGQEETKNFPFDISIIGVEKRSPKRGERLEGFVKQLSREFGVKRDLKYELNKNRDGIEKMKYDFTNRRLIYEKNGKEKFSIMIFVYMSTFPFTYSYTYLTINLFGRYTQPYTFSPLQTLF